MRLCMQTNRRTRPLRPDVRKRAFEHRVAQTDATECRRCQHTADADIGVVGVGQQHAQITR
jgi:hypothetical protein